MCPAWLTSVWILGACSVTYEVVPPKSETAMQSWLSPSTPPDWTPLFAAAGLDQKQFVAADPMWIPQKPFDLRASWNGTHAGFPVHIDGAAFHGKVVSFDVNWPWSTPQARKALPLDRPDPGRPEPRLGFPALRRRPGVGAPQFAPRDAVIAVERSA